MRLFLDIISSRIFAVKILSSCKKKHTIYLEISSSLLFYEYVLPNFVNLTIDIIAKILSELYPCCCDWLRYTFCVYRNGVIAVCVVLCYCNANNHKPRMNAAYNKARVEWPSTSLVPQLLSMGIVIPIGYYIPGIPQYSGFPFVSEVFFFRESYK